MKPIKFSVLAKNFFLLIVICCTFYIKVVSAELNITGSCRDFDFANFIGADGVYDTGYQRVSTVFSNVKAYSSKSGDSVIREFAINTKFYIDELPRPDSRVKVRLSNALGEGYESWWVEPQNLLCSKFPLYDSEQKISRRAFAKVVSLRDEESNVLAHTVLKGAAKRKSCENGDCKSIARFSLNYIWSNVIYQGVEYYLLSSWAGLSQSAVFSGWVAKKDVIEWNTATGFQPVADPKHSKFAGYDDSIENLVDSEFYLCGYSDKEKLKTKNAKDCAKIYADDQWFLTDKRLPLLEEGTGYIKTAISASGMADTQGNPAGIPLEKFKHLDVMFIIDGTSSMTTAFNAIVGNDKVDGAISKINQELTERLNQQGGSYRAGYQIYRDSVFVNGENVFDGIGGGYALPNANCSKGWTTQNKGYEKFRKAISAESASEFVYSGAPTDDYYENSLGGVARAVSRAAGCADRVKLFILIGDHGYSAEKQRARKNRPITTTGIGKLLYSSGSSKFRVPPIFSVIQMPNGRAEDSNSRDPYQAFYNQGRELVNKYHENLETQSSREDSEETNSNQRSKFTAQIAHFKRRSEKMVVQLPTGVTANSLSKKVTQIVTDSVLLSDEVLARIYEGIGNGNLAEELQSILNEPKFNGMPATLVPSMVRDACSQVGAAVCNGVVDLVKILYIPSEYVEKPYQNVLSKSQYGGDWQGAYYPVLLESQIWLTGAEFSAWTRLLRYLTEINGADRRKQFVEGIHTALRVVLKIDSETSDNRAFQEIVKNARLPGIAKSPIMAYKAKDLLDVADCEINLLQEYMKSKYAVLEAMVTGKYYPELKESRAFGCSLSLAGKSIPNVVSSGESKLIAPIRNRTRLNAEELAKWKFQWPVSESGSGVIYWIPKRYLP